MRACIDDDVTRPIHKGDVRAERPGDPRDRLKRGIDLTALDLADLALLDTGERGELLLGQSLALAGEGQRALHTEDPVAFLRVVLGEDVEQLLLSVPSL